MIDDGCSNRARLACNGFFLREEALRRLGSRSRARGVRKVVMWLRTLSGYSYCLTVAPAAFQQSPKKPKERPWSLG